MSHTTSTSQPVAPLRIKVQFIGGRFIYTLVEKKTYRLMDRVPVERHQPEARKWKRFFIEDILGQPSHVQMSIKRKTVKKSTKKPSSPISQPSFSYSSSYRMVSNTVAEVTQKRRIRSSEKERRRNLDLNEAFYRLQCQIPRLEKTQRLPRIKTLRMAILYINHLMDYLAGKQTEDFAQQAMQEMQVKNSYTSRIFEEEKQPLPPAAVEYYEISPPLIYAGMVYQPAPAHYWNASLPSGSDQSSP